MLHTANSRDYCEAEIRMYQSNGEVAFRRNYLMQVGEDADFDEVCDEQYTADLALAVFDAMLCFFLAVYTIYIGYSYLQTLRAELRSFSSGTQKTRVTNRITV